MITVKPAFEEISQLSEALAPTGQQVIDLVTGYIQSSATGSRSFDWPTFKAFIDNYKGDDLTFDQFNNDNIDQGNQKVSDIITNITGFYSSSSILLNSAELTKIITKVFTELKAAKASGWADFYSVDTKKSGWQYRIAFLLPYGSSTSLFKNVLTTIKIEAEVANEAGWYDLTADSVLKGFTGLIDLMSLVVVKGFENPLFDGTYLGLTNDLFSTAQQVMKLLNAYVKNEYGTTSLDWTGFKQFINDYNGDDLTFDRFSQGNTSDAKQTVKELVDKVVVYIRDVFNKPVDVTKLTQTIITTITSLQQKAGYGYLNFNPIDNKKSSWEYRVVAFAPMPTSKSYFYGTVITIKVTADVGEESSWWGLEESSSKVFSASTSALNLLVGKDYQYTTSK